MKILYIKVYDKTDNDYNKLIIWQLRDKHAKNETVNLTGIKPRIILIIKLVIKLIR